MSGKTTLRWALAFAYMAGIHLWTATGGRNPSSTLPFGGTKSWHSASLALAPASWPALAEPVPGGRGETAVFVAPHGAERLKDEFHSFLPHREREGETGGGTSGRGAVDVVSAPREGQAPRDDAGIGDFTLSSIRDALTEDMKAAMRAKETLRLSTIRMVRAEILNKDKEDGEETSQKDILKLLQSMVKKREEAAEQYAAADREDMARQERDEIQIIQGYLPAQMADAEIEAAAQAASRKQGPLR